MDEAVVRAALLALLGPGCFLHVHREEAFLYVTDFPARKTEAECLSARERLEKAGYTITPSGRDRQLWALDMTEEKWRGMLRMAENTPACSGHAGLMSLEKLFARFDSEHIPLARMLLKMSVQKDTDGDMCFRKISAGYALLLRRHEERPGKGCAGLIRQCMKRIGT